MNNDRKMSLRLKSNPLIELDFEVKCFSSETNNMISNDYEDEDDCSTLIYSIEIKQFGMREYKISFDYDVVITYVAYCSILSDVIENINIDNYLDKYIISSYIPEDSFIIIKRINKNNIHGNYNIIFINGNNEEMSIIVSYYDIMSIADVFNSITCSIDRNLNGSSYDLSDASCIVVQRLDDNNDLSYVYRNFTNNGGDI